MTFTVSLLERPHHLVRPVLRIPCEMFLDGS
jgi:hypothetical protein